MPQFVLVFTQLGRTKTVTGNIHVNGIGGGGGGEGGGDECQVM